MPLFEDLDEVEAIPHNPATCPTLDCFLCAVNFQKVIDPPSKKSNGKVNTNVKTLQFTIPGHKTKQVPMIEGLDVPKVLRGVHPPQNHLKRSGVGGTGLERGDSHIDKVHLMQRVLGTIGWVGVCHPAVASRHGELASSILKPSPKAFRVAKGVLRELRQKGLTPLEMVGVDKPEIRLWVDCAVHHHTGRRGWLLQIVSANAPITDRRNIVAWRSVKDKMKHGSSTAGEVNAVQQSMEDIEDQLLVASRMLPASTTFRILSDSQSGILQITNGGHSIKDRERAKYIKYLIQSVPFKVEGLNHVSGLLQMADPLTKPKELDWYDKYHSLL